MRRREVGGVRVLSACSARLLCRSVPLCGRGLPLLSASSHYQKRGCSTTSFGLAEQRALLEAIGKELGVKELSDWYTIPRRDITRKGGWRFAKVYPSFPAALKALYPEFPWDPYRFTRKARKRDYAYIASRQKAFLEDIGKQLGVEQLSDWYSISRSDVESKGGSPLFNHYSSLGEALSALYPEYEWDPLLFKQPPKGFWKEKANVLKAIAMAERQLGIETPEDWYSVTMSDLREVGFPYKFPRAKVVELLMAKYPNIDWRGWLLKGRYSLQKQLEKTVVSLFPEEELKVNVRKEGGLTLPGTNNYLELDLFLPELHLAFEFQEKHHYVNTNYTYHPVEFYTRRDRIKKDLAKANGISLIIVPYWWDGTKESLVATIQQMRPDLLPDEEGTGGEGIPEEMPPHFLAEVKPPHIEDIGEPQNACFFTLTSVDPTNWWLFEKYDGIRGFWNPLKKAFYSRQGKVLVLPQKIIDDMPHDTFLEGEIWFGVDTFQEVMKIVNRVNEEDIDWDKFKFMVFDLPKHEAPYATRYNELKKLLGEKNCKYAKVAPMEECKGIHHLEEFFQGVMDRGGEGIILRDPTALYEPGRSSGYLKHKKFRDAEARIIEAEGFNSWKCEMADGTVFTANASTDFAKRWQPKAGDIVSFKHHGFLLSSKKPKLPMIYRLRTDISWEDIVRNWKEKKPSSPSFRSLRSSLNRRPKGYWLDVNNRRKFFIHFAKEKGFDPLDPQAWAQVNTAQIVASKGNALLAMYKGSLKKALLRTFPELHFPFAREDAKGYWRDAANRRNFLIQVAEGLNFDPLNVNNWIPVIPEQITERNGAGLLKLYGGSLWRALADTFPEFGIEIKAKTKKQRARSAEPVGQQMRIGNFY